MYEYVTKAEYKPLKAEATRILQKMQSQLKKKFPFSFQLVGSGKRHLVTRIKNGNKGFDLDYNLILEGDCRDYDAKKVKDCFISAMRNALKDSSFHFSDPKDSSSVITLQSVDRKNSKIKYSCDFAIICYSYDEDSNLNGYKYLKNDKKSGNYIWNSRSINSDPEELVEKICEYENGWDCVRKEYLRLKDCNKGRKRSYAIYREAVNNVYEWLVEQDEEEPEQSPFRYL